MKSQTKPGESAGVHHTRIIDHSTTRWMRGSLGHLGNQNLMSYGDEDGGAEAAEISMHYGEDKRDDRTSPNIVGVDNVPQHADK